MIAPRDCLSCQVASGTVAPVGGFVYADELWTVNHMLPPAPILGWLILQPRRHIEALHEMTVREQQRMVQLMVLLDQLLRELLAPDKVYVCLFAEATDCPHVHFHIIPRAAEIEARGSEIFNYTPQTYPLEGEILDFVHGAREYLDQLM